MSYNKEFELTFSMSRFLQIQKYVPCLRLEKATQLVVMCKGNEYQQ